MSAADGFHRALSQVHACVLDLDGTLLTSTHAVAPATSEAVAEVRASGRLVVLASSRATVAFPVVLRDLPAVATETFVAAQGAVVARVGADGTLETEHERPLPLGSAHDLRRAATALDDAASLSWFTTDGWYVERHDDLVETEARLVEAEPEVVDLAGLGVPPAKLMVIAARRETAERIRAHAAGLGLTAALSGQRHVEVTAAGVDKAAAVRHLLAGRGIAMSAALAVGDGDNDVPLLRAAGLSASPATGTPQAHAAADRVVASHDAGGVADLLRAVAATPLDPGLERRPERATGS